MDSAITWPGRQRTVPAAEQRAAPLTFDGLYDEHFTFVWRSLRGMGVPADSVDDAVQDVFLVVHRRLPDYEARASIRSWLFGIALRVARDHRRRAARKPTVPLTEAPTAEAPDCPFESAARTEELDFVQTFADGLSEVHRAVFVLGQVQQLRAPEIAELLGENVNTIYSRLKAVRERFEQALRAHPELGRERERGGRHG